MRRIFLLACMFGSVAQAAVLGGSGSTSVGVASNFFNGSLVQSGPWSFGGDYALANRLQEAQDWTEVTGGTAVNPVNANQYGFPDNTAAAQMELTNLGGWTTTVGIPNSSTELTGNYIFDWVGYAEASAAASSGSTTVNSITGGGDCIVVSGTKVQGTGCTVNLTLPSSSTLMKVTIFMTGTAPLTQMRLYNIGDSPAINVGNDPFSAQFLIAQSVFGSVRFLDKGNFNTSNWAKWADRTPTTWWSYNAQYFPKSMLASNAITLSSNASYTLSFPGFTSGTPADKSHIIAAFASTVSPYTATLTSTDNVSVLGFSGGVPAGIVPGMYVSDQTSSGGKGLQFTTVVTSVGATSVTIACARSGPCTTPFWMTVNVGDTIGFSHLLSVNGGPSIPMLTNACLPLGSISTAASWGTTFLALTYDAGLNAWCIRQNSTTANTGLVNSWPPEVMVQLANRLGEHPWFPTPYYAADDSTLDYITNLATYVRANLIPGLIPRFEGVNENWNTAFAGTGYADIKEFLVNGVNFDHDNWYGRVWSQGCQAVSGVYGNPSAANRPNLYWCIAGMSAGDDTGLPVNNPANNQNKKMASPEYVSNGGSAACNWLTHVAYAGYWNGTYSNSEYELGWAYQYQTASAGTKSTLIGDFLAGSSLGGGPENEGHSFSLPNLNSIATSYASYLSGYGCGNVGLTQYEGGYNWQTSTTVDRTDSIIGITRGNPTVLTVAPSWSGWIAPDATANGAAKLTVTTPPAAGSIAVGTPVVCAGCTAGTVVVATSFQSGTTFWVSPSQTVGSSGSPVAMTGDAAWDYIYNTASLTGATTTIAGVGGTTCLNGNDYTINSATPTTITIAVDTTGCGAYTSGGTAAYDNSHTWALAFDVAAQQSSQLVPFELQNLQNFYTQGGRFPAEYVLSGTNEWAVFYPDVFSTANPKVTATQQYNAAP